MNLILESHTSYTSGSKLLVSKLVWDMFIKQIPFKKRRIRVNGFTRISKTGTISLLESRLSSGWFLNCFNWWKISLLLMMESLLGPTMTRYKERSTVCQICCGRAVTHTVSNSITFKSKFSSKDFLIFGFTCF